jgi:hypothetical protein
MDDIERHPNQPRCPVDSGVLLTAYGDVADRRVVPAPRRFEVPAKVKPSPSSGLFRQKADGSVEKIPL